MLKLCFGEDDNIACVHVTKYTSERLQDFVHDLLDTRWRVLPDERKPVIRVQVEGRDRCSAYSCFFGYRDLPETFEQVNT